jgi:hypothetical protein
MLLMVLVFCVVCFLFCVDFVCLRPVSCVPNIVSFSGLFILDYHRCYCAVHVYVIIPSCSCVLYQICVFIALLYICIKLRDPIIRKN